ncbi:N66 matrix protein-like [Helianthus annuus]|uniref:N66 matrix protein-like n=1 Tax=Helianthus annuus TaxID=4232 RepID=UPI000B9064D9|nr:N66 matrix protein-like [Helianthus annuus]
MVTSSKPETITEAIDLSVSLTEEAIRLNKFSNSDQKKKETHVESSGENKRKFSNFKKSTGIASKKKNVNPPEEAKTCVGRGGQRGYGNGNGNRQQGGNGGNGNHGNARNQAGNRGANVNRGGNGNGNGRGL